MTPARTAATLQRLETASRAQALLFAARAGQLRRNAGTVADALASTNVRMLETSAWSSFTCATFLLYSASCAQRIEALYSAEAVTRAQGIRAADDQLHWARLRRGLQRRVRRFQQARPWQS